MHVKTDERAEVVYTGPLTAASTEENATLDDGYGWRWVKATAAGLGRKGHTVTLSVRALSGREITSVGIVGEDLRAKVDAIYDVIGRCAFVAKGRLDSLEDLSWGAAVALWGYAHALATGEDPERLVREQAAREGSTAPEGD